MSFFDVMQEYLLEIQIRKYSPKTIRTYKNNLELFCRFCGDRQVEDFTISVISELILAMKHRKGTYVNSILKTVKSFMTYCYEQGYCTFNPKKSWKWVKQEKTIITAFRPEQVKRLLTNCSGADFKHIRDKAILTMFFETGIRCWELCCITLEDIHDDYIVIHGKNHKQRVVPITAPLAKALLKYDRVRDGYFAFKEIEPFYFLSFHGRQLTVSAIEVIMKQYGQGIEGIRVSPHTCRHFFAQQQVKMGTDLYTISRLLGHENIAITQTYLNSLQNEDIIKMSKENSVLLNL